MCTYACTSVLCTLDQTLNETDTVHAVYLPYAHHYNNMWCVLHTVQKRGIISQYYRYCKLGAGSCTIVHNAIGVERVRRVPIEKNGRELHVNGRSTQ